MDDQLLKHALAITGTVLYVVRPAPATIQIARRRDIDPEAALTFGLLILTGRWWVAYALEVRNVPSLVSALLGLPPRRTGSWSWRGCARSPEASGSYSSRASR